MNIVNDYVKSYIEKRDGGKYTTAMFLGELAIASVILYVVVNALMWYIV